MSAAETIAAAIERLASTDEPPIGSMVTDANGGWPWVRTVGGKWTRNACATFLTWEEIHTWHQAAVDDPDDETTEPFRPVVIAWGNHHQGQAIVDAQLAILREAHYKAADEGRIRYDDPAIDLARAILGEAS